MLALSPRSWLFLRLLGKGTPSSFPSQGTYKPHPHRRLPICPLEPATLGAWCCWRRGAAGGRAEREAGGEGYNVLLGVVTEMQRRLLIQALLLPQST